MARCASPIHLGVWRVTFSPFKGALLASILWFSCSAPAMAFADKVSTDWLGGIPENNQLAYEVTRKGKRHGFQVFDFSRDEAGNLIVDVHIEIVFKFGPLTLFRYAHKNREIWRDGKVQSIVSKTNNNGDAEFTDLQRTGDVLSGSGTKYAGAMADPIMPTSYFNPNFIRQTRFVSTQDGRLLEAEVAEIGRESVVLPTGSVETTRFRLLGKLAIDIWYTDAGQWVRTEFSRRGNVLLISPIDPANLPPRSDWARP
jgi:hypothetical protein